MQVSVVICVHSQERYDDFRAAAESVLAQTHDEVELVAVVDGNDAVCERVREAFGDREDVRIHCNESNRGLSYSRTRGVERASGEVIAFLDDDAIAREDWVEQLCRGYEEGALAVGGRMVPEWVDGEPDHLPAEFSWLVGVTYEPRLEAWTEVRNTMGSNISFRRAVFEELGGFDEQVGLAGDENLQAEETEFCIRMQQAFDRGVLYNPEAVVAHKVFEYRTEVPWLLRRAFWQGYSKRAVETLGGDRGDAERDFLSHLCFTAGPRRLRGLIEDPSLAAVQQLCLLVALTAAVGVGYLYAFRRW
jgi:glycosyltransferase involved in cell wall biosynthesis